MQTFSYFGLLWAVATAQTLIPDSTGPYAVSLQDLVLTDSSRWEPNAPEDGPQKRRFIASLFLPLEPGSCEQAAVPYLTPSAEEAWGQTAPQFGLPAEALAGFEIEYCTPIANVTQSDAEFPVILFGPGLGTTRLFYAAQAKELASHGYFVITVDYPYETFYVEFPDGTSIYGIADVGEPTRWSQIRADDMIYILDSLDSIASDLPIRIDASKVLQYGHSLGGNTAALTALRDKRILGALNIDGDIHGPVLEQGLDTPYVFLSQQVFNYTRPGFPEMWESFHGPKLLGILEGTTHNSFLDFPTMFDVRGIPLELVEIKEMVFGTIEGLRLIEVVTSLVMAFASFVFEGEASDLKAIGERFEDLEVYEDSIPSGCSRSSAKRAL
ncbi:hypothetical protein S40285_09596 [Stachybotrys chlorohalonatus IBT 40285]|uniref:1-alkyl-2-acetylglycerophosphocholine esterase n=1 Tax=Stachybotrys chlorohalonatus (strain IBT 40285) TaxID=1283841 RepID=A0A084Q848_STAC4|nr:hypothetical protein S40285_09596 [Stachybotrys chlorohalonata IBT 40285]